MKPYKYSLITLFIILLAISVFGGQPKARLPLSAYLKSAKIAMLANPPRHTEALGLLDSLLYFYGKVPEAYFLRGNIIAEFAANENDFGKKVGLFGRAAANYDSMALACEDKDVKGNLKNDCKKFSGLVDSIKALYWRKSYDDGVKAINRIDEELSPEIKNSSDSVEIAAAEAEIKAVADSALASFSIAAAIEPKNYRSLEGKALIFDKTREIDSALVYFKDALDLAPDSGYLIQNVAYGYIQLNQWENAITYFKKFLVLSPNDGGTISNIAICYNNIREFDSARTYDLKAIAIDPNAGGPYIDLGQYFLIKSQMISDSIKVYKQADNNAVADKFLKTRDEMLDSSGVYFDKGVALEPDNVGALEQNGVVKMVRGHYEDAAVIFTKLANLEPNRREHWINLGDIYVQLQKFESAIQPYEKAIELDPGDAKLWEVLKDLYTNANMPDKAKQAELKIEELKKL